MSAERLTEGPSAPETRVWDVVVIGGGPAGLAAAEAASARGASVLLVERMPTLGRKLLMAGKSGLNLTFDEPEERFATRFGASEARLRPMIEACGPSEVRAWAEGLGQACFTGSSGRVFPRAMKASPLLRAWIRRLEGRGVEIRTRRRWSAWRIWRLGLGLAFEAPGGEEAVWARTAVLALGGASWPRLGADGAWTPLVAERADVVPFRPANMGFDVAWSAPFRARFAGAPVKGVAVSADGAAWRPGEFVISAYGVEGSGVYGLSAALRDQMAAGEGAALHVDLAPNRSPAALTAALAKPRGKASTANWLRKAARIEGVKAGLLREAGAPPRDPAAVAARIKDLRIALTAPRPLTEAISSAGGVSWGDIDGDLMLKEAPGAFVCGEMIDWEAPTGGYLLSACIALGRWAGESAAVRAIEGARAV